MKKKCILRLGAQSFTLLNTVFPHIRPAGINFLLGLQVRVLLEITEFHLHKSVPTAGIIRVAGVIRGRALYEEIQNLVLATSKITSKPQ